MFRYLAVIFALDSPWTPSGRGSGRYLAVIFPAPIPGVGTAELPGGGGPLRRAGDERQFRSGSKAEVCVTVTSLL